MEELINEIKNHFAAKNPGIRPLVSLKNCPAYSYRETEEYGLAIEYDNKNDIIYEEANQVYLYTKILTTNNGTHTYLLLVCCDEQYRNKFAELSFDFVNPGYNNDNRKALLSAPRAWWSQWVGLLGDRKSNRSSYDIVAELLALDYLYQDDKSIQWTASEAGTHDIESDTTSFEIKSTIKKSETNITVSSQHQLASANPLFLFFFRMEKSLSGYSINDVVQSLVSHGYDAHLIESQLEKKGFIKGNSIRDKKYTILEIRKYVVNDKFPRIVEKSFKGDKFPENIIKIVYTIDLAGIEYKSIFFTLAPDGTINGREIATNANVNTQMIVNDTISETKYQKYDEWREGLIPIFSLRAACSYFEDEETPEMEGWIDATGYGFTPNKERHFVIQAKGNSMLPKIKDGDYCVFEWYQAGSRDGAIVLMKTSEYDPEYDGKYTIKKYHSEVVDGKKKIELIPLNSDYEKIILDEYGQYRTIGIFKKVL